MKKAIIAGHNITYYDGDITEMPVVRFQAFQKFLLIDAGIGSSLEDVDRHIERIRIYVERDKKENAIVELTNMRHNLQYVIQGVSPENLAFCALVHEVDGIKYNDLSDEGISELCGMLSQTVPQGFFRRMMWMIKKKVNWSLTRTSRGSLTAQRQKNITAA